jgi:recombination protein RecA
MTKDLSKVNAALAQVEKQYGKGSIMKLGEKPRQVIDVIPSGSIGINGALGIGGWPKGRIVEVMGPESSGKTTISIHAIVEAQKAGGLAAFIDMEHAFDPIYAKNLGVNIDDLYISQPDHAEQALETVDILLRSEQFDLIVIDSVAALVPKAELEGEMEDNQMGLQARIMSKAMRKLTGFAQKSNTCLFFINQIRNKIGVVYGSPETTSGGNALKFFSSVRVDIRKGEQIKDGENVIGTGAKIKVIKNKLAAPFQTTTIDIMYGRGISKASEILDAGLQVGLIKKSGSWFSYGDTKLGQGKTYVLNLLEDNPELMEEIENKIYNTVNEQEG